MWSMKREISALISILILPAYLFAQSVQDSRRIEEEKRESLNPTETRTYQAAPDLKPQERSIEFDYLQELFSKKTARLSDAAKVLTILLGAKEKDSDFESQLAFLRGNGILSEKLIKEPAADMPLRKGVAAYLFSQALDIKGGIWLRLFGMSQRYALRELVYEGIMRQGSVNEILKGEELVSMFINAVDFLTRKKT